MNPKRKKRLYIVLFLFAGAAATVGLLLAGLGENVNMFYPPADVVAGKAPVDRNLRADGMVLEKLAETQRLAGPRLRAHRPRRCGVPGEVQRHPAGSVP